MIARCLLLHGYCTYTWDQIHGPDIHIYICIFFFEIKPFSYLHPFCAYALPHVHAYPTPRHRRRTSLTTFMCNISMGRLYEYWLSVCCYSHCYVIVCMYIPTCSVCLDSGPICLTGNWLTKLDSAQLDMISPSFFMYIISVCPFPLRALSCAWSIDCVSKTLSINNRICYNPIGSERHVHCQYLHALALAHLVVVHPFMHFSGAGEDIFFEWYSEGH